MQGTESDVLRHPALALLRVVVCAAVFVADVTDDVAGRLRRV